ncbi:MAG: hypothetical protein A2Y79_06035 [Deltaproteobacteria bacterium RBG_13_43_22]|nr:MAG: hypothetical protein A2Y79_06035 [Deltaproteobacteria bacterium RBG_13_43_22]
MPLVKRIWDLMDPNVETITPETPLKEACAILTGQTREKKGNLGLVVKRSSGEYLGLLTTKDILKYAIYLYNKAMREGKKEDWATQIRDYCKDESLITVNDIIVHNEVFVRPNQNLFEVIQIMDNHDLEVMPVVDTGKIIGMIRSADILGEIARSIL